MGGWLRRLGLAIICQGCIAAGALSQIDARISTFPGSTWEVRSPEEVGLNEDLLTALSAQVGGGGLIIKDGYRVFDWGSRTTKRDWMSAAKPVTSTLLLFAVKEGLLSSQHDLVAPFVEQEFGLSLLPKDSLMTFNHLANMTSGYALPVDPGPGSRWGYNDYAIKLYSKLLANQVFGGSLNDVATHPARLGALQFQDGAIYSSRQGLGVHTSPRDFARIGWFWLNRGYWDGVQLLPDEAFDALLSVGVDPDTPTTGGGLDDYLGVGTYGGGTNQTSAGPGVYGFNFWTNAGGSLWPDAPDDTYQANGGWNRHVVTVIPSLKIVAIWSNSPGDDPEDFAGPMNQALKLLTESAGVVFNVAPGWSQASPPVRTGNMSVTALMADPEALAFRFEGGRYEAVDSMEVGRGYIVRSAGVSTTLHGEHVLPQRTPVKKGWNLAGLFHQPISTEEIDSDPPGIIDSVIFGQLDGTESDDEGLVPGQAYWIRVTQDGYVTHSNETTVSKHRPVVRGSGRKRRERISRTEPSPPGYTGSSGGPE